jgi:Cdc6-like AAA superfamily ATPase
MISTPSNLLCLGRSGTGKTTCSALRLFSTDTFYKYMEELRAFKIKNPTSKMSEFKVDPDFANTISKLKLVFVTASPVLTNEVKKFYGDMKIHFTDELIKRRTKAAQQVEEEKNGSE